MGDRDRALGDQSVKPGHAVALADGIRDGIGHVLPSQDATTFHQVVVMLCSAQLLAEIVLLRQLDHTADVIGKLEKKPAVMGHSTGGLFAQMLAGRGLSAVTVAIDPGVFRGVVPLPLATLKVIGPFVANPRYRGRAITVTFDQFKYGWTNALEEAEARRLYDTYHVAGSGIALA